MVGPTLEVLVFGEGAGGGARLGLSVDAEGGTDVEFPGGGPGGGLRGDPCEDNEPDGLFLIDADCWSVATPPVDPMLEFDMPPAGTPGGGRRGEPPCWVEFLLCGLIDDDVV